MDGSVSDSLLLPSSRHHHITVHLPPPPLKSKRLAECNPTRGQKDNNRLLELVVICFCSAFHTRTISIHLYIGYASSSSFPLASQSLFFMVTFSGTFQPFRIRRITMSFLRTGTAAAGRN